MQDEITEGTIMKQKELGLASGKILQENVIDMVSFHSKYSKSVFETASAKKSVKSSVLSVKKKGQLDSQFKKVQFFALKSATESKSMLEEEDDDKSESDCDQHDIN